MLHLAAKQEAFEESTKLKNQFRNLDEDEVEFLDSVLESTRAKEEAVKKETTEQLDLFRKQQEEADKAILEEVDEAEVGTGEAKAGSPTAEGSAWAVNARKRKRVKEKEGLKGIKLRKSSSATEPSENTASFNNVENEIALTAPKKDAGEKAETVSVTSAAGIPIAETVDQLQTSPNEIALSGSTKSSNGTVSEPTATGGLGLGGYSSEEDG